MLNMINDMMVLLFHLVLLLAHTILDMVDAVGDWVVDHRAKTLFEPLFKPLIHFASGFLERHRENLFDSVCEGAGEALDADFDLSMGLGFEMILNLRI